MVVLTEMTTIQKETEMKCDFCGYTTSLLPADFEIISHRKLDEKPIRYSNDQIVECPNCKEIVVTPMSDTDEPLGYLAT